MLPLCCEMGLNVAMPLESKENKSFMEVSRTLSNKFANGKS